jgi:sulfur relay (sulfurtransferase) complex TusBCD TusD component (DsrE family)
MKNLKFIITAFVIVLSTSFLTTVKAEEHKGGLFVNLTTDDGWAAGKAIMFAHKRVLARGHKPVAIWLNVRAINLADKKRATDASIKPLQDKLRAFIKDGGMVVACSACAKRIGLSGHDLVAGIKMGNPDLVMGLLFDPSVKTLSW